ncbi:MAG TPA: RagB/SusD family nutrient uptake outer membrane protein [Flavisolibacter sp.]
MKKIQIISALITGAVVLSTLSCGKKFLTEEPRTVTIQDLLNNPDDGAKRLVGAIYSKLYDWQQHSFSWNGISSITSDDADKGSDPGDTGADKHEMDDWTFNPSSLSFFEVWESNYEGIGRATYAIKFLNEMGLDAPTRDRYVGEAKLLRAYFYFNLVRTFGGVPKVDKVLETQAEIEAASAKVSAAEIYSLIETDLADAILKLPVSVPSSENGRVTKGAAQALLAKVSLYQQKWGQAKSMSDAILNSGQYALLSNYALIWREAGEFSSESIWEVNAIGTTPNRGIEGYFVTQAPRGTGGLGWGFNTPTADLVNAYEPNDVRKAATIIFAGQTLWDGFVVNAAAPNPRYNYKSYVSKTQETFNGEDWNSNKNLRIFRLGEIFLIKAEAENELNNLGAARIALDTIRKRAGLSPTTASNKDQMREAIYRERRVEMAFEHDRMFDLRRTGRAEAVLTAHGKNYVSPKHDLFPIPQRQIDLSNGKLIQNPGY